MLDFSKQLIKAPIVPVSGELRTGDLLEGLADHGGKKLVFAYEGQDVSPGYHVTEVKDGVFNALDCGANPESWRETFIQLWDVPPVNDRGHMPVSLFLKIMKKVSDHVAFDPDAKLTFEVSDGKGAIQLYRAESLTALADNVRVELSRRPASCKPRDRWLVEGQKQKSSSGCCGASAKRCG
jgi:hypothetical protein